MSGKVELKKMIPSWLPGFFSVAVSLGVVMNQFAGMREDMEIVKQNQMDLAKRGVWMEHSNELHQRFLEHLLSHRPTVATMWTRPNAEISESSQVLDL